MYSILKKYAIAVIILGVFHMVAAGLCALYMSELPELPVTASVGLIAFYLLSGLISLIIGIGMYNFQDELSAHSEYLSEDISALKKRIDKLEISSKIK